MTILSRRYPGGIQEVLLHTGQSSQYSYAHVDYVVKDNSGAWFIFYIDGSTDLYYRKSIDNGRNWQSPVLLNNANPRGAAIWFDRWSGIAAGLIHIAYLEDTSDDILYRSLDTENSDTLSAEITVFAGASGATGAQLAITRARGGNLYVRGCIDAGAEGGFFRSTDVGANWTSQTINEALATQDQMILLPGWAADNQDIMGIFWDASADEISMQLYDNSGDTWAETSIAASMVDLVANGQGFPNFAATVDIANSRNVLVAWSNTDVANSDLRCWTVTESAQTEVTNVVENSTDDQYLCAIGIDTTTGYWHVWYCGKSDGSETYNTSMNVYKKISTDSGATWGAEAQVSYAASQRNWLCACPRFTGSPLTAVMGLTSSISNFCLREIAT